MTTIDLSSTEWRRTIISQIEADPEAELLKATHTSVEAYDGHDGRYVTFRLARHTAATLTRRLFIGENLLKNRNPHKTRFEIAIVLCRLDPVVLMNLKRIFIIDRLSDIRDICAKYGYEDEDLPDALWDECENLNDDALGVSWFQESSVFVNMAAIRKAACEIWPDDADMAENEITIGFWTTLLHELRHMQLDCCPYDFPWLEDADDSESGVEEWCRLMYEHLFEHGPKPG